MAENTMTVPNGGLHPKLFEYLCFRSDSGTPVADGVAGLRKALNDTEPRIGIHYGRNLRLAISYLQQELRSSRSYEREHGPRYVSDGPTGAERDRLIASLEEAGRHAEAWCKRTGCPLVYDTPDADAARQGWPDADGNAWTPPWDLLDMEPPDWWGKPPEGSGKV